MRDLLAQASYELGVLFEHGLSSANAAPLATLAKQLFAYKMPKGAAAFQSLSDSLIHQKQHARQDYTSTVTLYTALWEYVLQCKKQLDHLELLYNLQPEPSEDDNKNALVQ